MKSVQAYLDDLKKQRDNLDQQIRGVEDSLRLFQGEQPKAAVRTRRPNVKEHVFRLLDRVGTDGLNAAIAVAMAEKENVALDRGTVSSLLSRLKNEGAVAYDGAVYRLVKFCADTPAVASQPSPIVNFPASKGVG